MSVLLLLSPLQVDHHSSQVETFRQKWMTSEDECRTLQVKVDSLQRCASLTLKTLFNILEAPLKKNFELWCLCCMMMFRWTNKEPGIQKFCNSCGHYQDDWISPLNKWSGSPFIITQQSMGENKYGKYSHLSIFTSLKHFWCTVFSGLHFYTLSKTLIACTFL